MNAASRHGFYRPLLFLPLAALLVVVPYFFRETSCGHDLTFHITSWLETTQQWKEGIFYPRWAAEANYGHGEPRFIFYPPISWLLGALLGKILQWVAVPGALAFLACTASGFSMYAFAREWLEERTALFAAILYAVNPYQLMVIYERSALAELVAAALIPFILVYALRERDGFLKQTVLLCLPLAATWLTNAPAGVMATYLLLVIALGRTMATRKWEPILRAVAALSLAMLLAAFYLVPASYEQKWVIISQAISPGSRPQDNFLFARIGDADHDAVLHRVSLFCVLEFVALALVTMLAAPLRRKSRYLYWTLVTIAAACVCLMLPMSNVIWQHLPKLAYLQFPWRWLLVLNVVLAVMAAVSVARIGWAPVVLAVGIPAMILVGYAKFHQVCYPEDRVMSVVEQFRSGRGFEGTDEYCPITGDNYNIDGDTPTPRIASSIDGGKQVLPGAVHSSIQRWDAEHRSLTINAPVPTRNTLRLMNYPAWKVEVDGATVTPENEDGTGRMVLALSAGHHQVEIQFTRTPDRLWGGVLSLIGLALTLSAWVVGKRSSQD